MVETKTRAFFGDAEHDFQLTPEMIVELERLIGSGIGTIFGRLARNEFSFTEVVETIRLGLIGGGMAPQKALALVDAYARRRPMSETLPTALAVLEALWFGVGPVTEEVVADV